jgi:hypothetical protein
MSRIPRRLRQRPRDSHGRVIPYVVLILPDGTPEFRAPDTERWKLCLRQERCSLCGVQMRDGYWFVGGPRCADHRLFMDPPMHHDCARYALQVCPFLAMSKAHYSSLVRRPPPPGFVEVPGASDERPERFMLGEATVYKMVRVEGVPFIKAGMWRTLHWWKDGVELDEVKRAA